VGVGVTVGVNDEVGGAVGIHVVGVAAGSITVGLGERVRAAKGCVGVCRGELHPMSVKSARRHHIISMAGNGGIIALLSGAGLNCFLPKTNTCSRHAKARAPNDRCVYLVI